MEYKLHALKSVSKIKQHALKGQKPLAQEGTEKVPSWVMLV